jgi:poly-gamma-glutamate capsule biosynthesis protein CapA/YwtB (metallophosphatase superfamily)
MSEAAVGRADLILLGDVMLGRGVDAEWRAGKPADAFWGSALPALRDADGVFANLECAITAHPARWSRTPKVFHFRASPGTTEILRAANIRWVSLANNHSLDFEAEGLLDTIGHLDRAGIAHAGAGRDRAAAMAPSVVTVGGGRVGLIALTDNEPPFAATDRRPGTWYTPIAASDAVLAPIAERIAALRRAGATLVIVSVHWGPNMVVEPPPHHRTFAHALIGLGADVVHGHSAHVMQGVEIWRSRPILYDTGDVLDDYAVDPVLRNDYGMLFRLTADPAGPIALIMRPLRLSFAQVDLAEGETAMTICARMARLSASLGTTLRPCPEGLDLTLR